MATIEEVKSKLAARLSKYKVQTPTRIAYLGDGRGNATSNMVPIGEPNKFWARESLDGDKPFKITNKNPNLTPAFNLPVLLGYPEEDPTHEQVLGLHSALIKLDAGGNVSGSSIGGAPPHRQKHEWGGGDTVYVDPRMFKPGLVAPTNPLSMKVRILSFQHYYNNWRKYDGGISPSFSQYLPDSDYRYVLVCLDPDTNQLTIHPGSVFSPDVSIDSIISNSAKDTFRHIPVPPGNEIPLGAVLLEPGTTKIDWNPEGVNNLMPMRLLLSTPTKSINDRLDVIESKTGVGTLPQTGAAQFVEDDLLPGRIDGNRTRIVLNRSSLSQNLPTLLVGELGYENNAPSRLIIGTASGNKIIQFSGGGGASVLDELDDVRIGNLEYRKALVYDNGASIWTSSSKLIMPWIQVRPSEDGDISAEFTDGESSFYGQGAPFIVYDSDTNMAIGLGWSGSYLEWNGDFQPINFRMNGQNDVMLEIDANNEVTRFATANASCALGVEYNNDVIKIASSVDFYKFGTSNVDGDSYVFFAGGHGFHIGGSPITGNTERMVLYELDPFKPLQVSARSRNNSELYRFTKYGRHPSLPIDVSYFVETLSAVDISAGSEDADWSIQTKIAGTMGSRLRISPIETVFNGAQIDHDTKIATSSNASMLVVDSGLGALQIGTSIAGQIADFRDHLIEFNKNQNETTIRFSGSGASDLFVIRPSGVGIGTSQPAKILDIVLGPAGGIISSDVTDNNTTKDTRFLLRHYDNSEEAVACFGGASYDSSTEVRFGGGYGVQNSATKLRFFASPTNTTTGGTEIMTAINTGVGIGTGSTGPDSGAILELKSTTGALLLPRMTTTQRNAITGVDGMIIYNLTISKVQAYAGGTWVNLH